MVAVNEANFNRETNLGNALLDLQARIVALEAGTVAAGSISTAELAPAAVTPAKLSPTGRKTCVFRGRNGAGAITGATGLVVGDRLESVTLLGTAADTLLPVLVAGAANPAVTQPSAQFGPAVTTTAEIPQAAATDLSANLYLATFIPASS